MKVIVNGAQGRMGSETVKTIEAAQDMELLASLGREDNLEKALNSFDADIVIDFTTPDVVYANTQCIIEHGVHPIIGTTGLSADQIKTCQAQAHAKSLGGIIAPNFSLGAIMLMKLSLIASEYFPDIEIIETHHPKKLDKPSGTALKTAALIQEQRQCDIPIHSVRLPGFVANQEVIFGGQAETLSIHHRTLDRSCFMPGVLLACRRVKSLNELIYGLESLI